MRARIHAAFLAAALAAAATGKGVLASTDGGRTWTVHYSAPAAR